MPWRWPVPSTLSRTTQRVPVKVFRLNDCDWYAGSSLQECIEHCVKETGFAREDAADSDARELTDAEMERLKFIDGEPGDKAAPRITFKERLAQMVAEGTTFPCFFASTEY